jgi:hypothetical protein
MIERIDFDCLHQSDASFYLTDITATNCLTSSGKPQISISYYSLI